jgi:hypothetical protein
MNSLTAILLGFFSSFQISVPSVLAHRRLLLQGVKPAFCGYFGIVCGQLAFLYPILSGKTGFVEYWSSLEPILYPLGILISGYCILSITHRDLQPSLAGVNRSNIPVSDHRYWITNPTALFGVFLESFFLMYLNPTYLFNPSDLFWEVDTLDYPVPLFLFFSGISLLLGFAFIALILRVIQGNGINLLSFRLIKINRAFSIFLIMLCAYSFTSFHWRYFFQLPFDTFLNSESNLIENQQSQKRNKDFTWDIELGSTNVRNRELLYFGKAQSRVLDASSFESKQSEIKNTIFEPEQVSELKRRYNSHPINIISSKIENSITKLQTPFLVRNTTEQIKLAQKLRDQWFNTTYKFRRPVRNSSKIDQILRFARPTIYEGSKEQINIEWVN